MRTHPQGRVDSARRGVSIEDDIAADAPEIFGTFGDETLIRGMVDAVDRVRLG
jgi:hypothetical protein